MKKIAFIIVLLAKQVFVFSQSSNVTAAWNYMNYYNNGDGVQNLEKARTAIDEAAVNEKTSGEAKTWFYRGQVYQLIFSDSTLRSQHDMAHAEAIKSYKKVYEMNDPKFKAWKDLVRYLLAFGPATFNSGITAYQQKNYQQGYKYFASIEDINTIIESRGEKPNIDLDKALANAALCAENSGNLVAAIDAYKKLSVRFPDPKHDLLLARLQKKSGDRDGAMATLDAAIAKYPQNIDLIIDKLNIYISEDKHELGLDMLNKAIALDPKNDQLYYALGTAYEKLGKGEEAKNAYEKAIQLNPKNFGATYNLGAYYFNKAGQINEEMNKLGYSKADQIKYEELKKKRSEIFKQAKPYFEKCKELNPDDASTLKALKQIELYSVE
ncbi:MAG: tetratricopeptide repeat protein [Chitinophagales bacterium]|nr:tetratricopeptide repeat protein [Chitinophagales bacterium]MDW8273710.1 tetratricopeptide repeat protein [Chitinophagales bacterium]